MNWTEEEFAEYLKNNPRKEQKKVHKPLLPEVGKPKIKESDIQRGIRDYLEWHGFFVRKIAQGAFSTPGIPDLWCIGKVNGKLIQAWVEVKTLTGKISSEQQEFMTQVSIRGGTCVVMRSIDDCVKWLRVIE